MEKGSIDISSIFKGTTEVPKIYLGNNVVYEKSSSSMKIYMDGSTMVLSSGLEMTDYSTNDTYELPEDIRISNLLNSASGTLSSDSTAWSYYPSFTEETVAALTTTKVSSSSITIDGTTYAASATDTAWESLWSNYIIPNMFANSTTSCSAAYACLSSSEVNHYYTIKCSGLSADQGYLINNWGIRIMNGSTSYSPYVFQGRIIIHTNSDVTDTTSWQYDVDGIRWTARSGVMYMSDGTTFSIFEVTPDANGEFYITILIPNQTGQDTTRNVTEYKGSGYVLTYLYNTDIGISYYHADWGSGPVMQISFQSLTYGSSEYEYLANVQRDGSAVISLNPNYSPT